MSQAHYDVLARAFDRAAPGYDRLYRANPIMAWMRGESLRLLEETLPPGSRLLEIGCGTGEEALALAAMGHRVVATDISPAMIEVGRAKAAATGLPITWLVSSAGSLGSLEHELKREAFNGAYSSFGALNCEPRLADLAKVLARWLPPGAPFVCSVMNYPCLWETTWHLLHGQPSAAFRRGRQPARAGLTSATGRAEVPVTYYRPDSFAAPFAPWFRPSLVRALGLAVPPPYLAPALGGGRVMAVLTHLERLLRDLPLFRGWGDHFIVVLRRSPAPSPSL